MSTVESIHASIVEQDEYSCPYTGCGYKNQQLISLSVHWRKRHGRKADELRILLFHDGVQPTCACGCGELTKFLSIEAGFTEWIRGHVSRVRNNWGHNDAAQEKSIETRREMWKAGEIVPWCKGLKKGVDPAIDALVAKSSATVRSNSSEIARRSDRMREGRLNGTIPTLTGSAHPRWKGGTSSMQALCRSHLFRPWVYPRLVASGFRCSKCGSDRELCVHHDSVRFAEVLHRAMTELLPSGSVTDATFEQKFAVAERVVEIHLDPASNVTGVVLCEACHDNEHAHAD